MNLEASKLNPRPEEVLRYMGWKNKLVDLEGYDRHLSLVISELEYLMKIIRPKYVYSSIDKKENQELFYQLFFLSKGKGELTGIEKFICELDRVYLGVVTLGFEFENLLKVAGNGDSSKLLLLEACGTELIETAMNYVETEIREIEESEISSRFSPGYGGWELKHQKQILDYLQAQKLGIYLNDYNIMIPRKSVTAVIKMEAFNGGCHSCEKKDCQFKKI